jgi:hypothetical protein
MSVRPSRKPRRYSFSTVRTQYFLSTRFTVSANRSKTRCWVPLNGHRYTDWRHHRKPVVRGHHAHYSRAARFMCSNRSKGRSGSNCSIYALTNDVELKKRQITIRRQRSPFRYSGGDARKLLNIIELVSQCRPQRNAGTHQRIGDRKPSTKPSAYDKQGEMHYDIISAFIKSIRGSDPDAAMYWLARMIEGGEDVKVHCPQAGHTRLPKI